MIGDLSAALTGLLLGLNLPAGAPLWMPVVGGLFAILIVKQLFGGIGKNIVNPALAARVFLFSWPDDMTKYTKPFTDPSPFSLNVTDVDVIAGATPLMSFKEGSFPSDASLVDMLLGNTSGVIGEVSALLLLLGGIYLMARKVIKWHIPVTFIGVIMGMAFVFPQITDSVDYMLASAISGGVMLGAFYMATDYATSPMTDRGKLIYGAGCGLLTVLIRYFGAYPEGVSFAILIMNLLVWYIDRFTRPVRFGGVTRNGK